MNGRAGGRPIDGSVAFMDNNMVTAFASFVQGGGWRFVRYNCSAMDVAVGHTLMHPGQMTHWYEGLALGQGTYYNAISYIDP